MKYYCKINLVLNDKCNILLRPLRVSIRYLIADQSLNNFFLTRYLWQFLNKFEYIMENIIFGNKYTQHFEFN